MTINDDYLREIKDAYKNWDLRWNLRFDKEELDKHIKTDYTKHAKRSKPKYFAYKKVIFNPPATIVLWEDGQKTVVKCSENDEYDYEKGLALCFMKRALGNTSGDLNKVLHKETDYLMEEWDDPEI